MSKAFQFAKLALLGIFGLFQLSGCTTAPTVTDLHVAEVSRAIAADFEKVFSDEGDLTPYGYETFFGKSYGNDFATWQSMKPAEKLAFLETSPLVVARSLFVWERDKELKSAFKTQNPQLSDFDINLHFVSTDEVSALEVPCIKEKWMAVDTCVFFFTPVADITAQNEAERRIDQYRKEIMLRQRGQTAMDMARRSMDFHRHSMNHLRPVDFQRLSQPMPSTRRR
jgi:hypothetical protein